MFTICVEPFKIDDKIVSDQMTIMDKHHSPKLKLYMVTGPQKFMNCCRKCVWLLNTSQHNFTLVLKTRCGRLRTSSDNTPAAIIVTILKEERHVTCTEIAMESGIPQSSAHHVVTEVLGKRKVAAWSVLHT
jgi:hypothetical protein